MAWANTSINKSEKYPFHVLKKFLPKTKSILYNPDSIISSNAYGWRYRFAP